MSALLNPTIEMPFRGASTTTWRLAYAQIGWHTFLVYGIDDGGRCTCKRADCKTPGKHPIHAGKDRGATLNAVQIRREGMSFPQANVAVHLGLSHLICVDVDPRNGGSETLDKLEGTHSPLDAAIVAVTGGGGSHHFFRLVQGDPMPPNKGSLGVGVDLLNGNRYPVIAPSRHRSGEIYEWLPGHDPWESGWLISALPHWILGEGGVGSQSAPNGIVEDQDWTADLDIGKSFDWTARSVSRLRSALRTIPADERNTWLQIGAALHHASEGGDDGRELWDEWSVGSIDFVGCPEKYASENQDETWRGFDAGRTHARTVSSIFYEAKQLGWIDPDPNAAPDTLGDISNGRRFATRYQGKYLYVRASRKWLRWDGVRWAMCDGGQELQAAKALADIIVREAAETFTHDPDEGNKRRYGLALAVHRSLPRLHAMLEASKAEPKMSVPDESFLDADPMLLGVRNGVVDLRTGMLLSPKPDQRISKQVGAAFHLKARCPRWDAFLEEVFGSEEVVALVQRLVGYTLTGLVDEEILVFMYGTGANGKSVFANLFATLLGDYAITVGTELLARNKSEGETARYKAALQGASGSGKRSWTGRYVG